jgi:hypothetical protein
VTAVKLAPVEAHFQPFRVETPTRARGCLICADFHGQFYGGHLLCERDGGRHVVGVPAMGCAFLQREAGAGDESERQWACSR